METSKVHISAYLTDCQLLVFNITNLINASDIVEPVALITFPQQTLSEVLDLFRKHLDASYLPVLDQADDGLLLGILNQNDVLASFRSIQQATACD